ncbi:hypothetical protein [Roseibium algae]|uniref:Minor tail protein n=1 Tax=Roseibium algae TaxID=3123038 RepID=A0ABU8TLG8_9HYPH
MSIEVVRGASKAALPTRLVITLEEKSLTVATFIQEPPNRTHNLLADQPVQYESRKADFTTTSTSNGRTGAPDLSVSGIRVTFDDIDWSPDELVEVLELRNLLAPEDQIPDPYAKPVFTSTGKISFFLDGLVGADEVVPYSIIDLLTSAGYQPSPWVNRLQETRRGKVLHAARWRASQNARMAVSIYFPFVSESLFDQHIHVVSSGYDPIINHPIDNIVDEADLPGYGAALWQSHFWHVHADGSLKVSAGDLVDVPVVIRQNEGGGLCEEDLTLRVSSDCGYLPKRRIRFEAGKATIRVRALDLIAGDIMKVKINTEHFSGVGSFQIEVQ